MGRRLVAIGRKQALYPTVTIKYALADPAWKDAPRPWWRTDVPDFDELRKQKLEEAEDKI